MNEYLAQEQREAEAREKANGWFPVFLQWIPNMLIAVVLMLVLFLAMFYSEHGSLDITKEYQNPFITSSVK